MLEHVFYKGAVIPGTKDFFREDPAGSIAETSTPGAPLTMSAFEMGIIERGTVDGLFLPYRPRAINYVVPNGKDVISSKFTGCYMVKYKLKGATRVGHVSTPDCNDLWRKMKNADSGFELVAEFKPTDFTKGRQADEAFDKAVSIGGNSGPETLGIITATNDCFGVNIVRQNKGGVTTIHVVSISKV